MKLTLLFGAFAAALAAVFVAFFHLGPALPFVIAVALCTYCLFPYKRSRPGLALATLAILFLLQASFAFAEDAAPSTIFKGGTWAASFVEWLQVAFGGAIGLLATALLYKVFGYFGIQTTQMQRDQLQAIVVNGLNAAAAKAQVSLRTTDKLDFQSKSAIVNDAIAYAQAHAAETIKALGLDPNSGEAVQAIRARIETALNDPAQPTPAAITPASGLPA